MRLRLIKKKTNRVHSQKTTETSGGPKDPATSITDHVKGHRPVTKSTTRRGLLMLTGSAPLVLIAGCVTAAKKPAAEPIAYAPVPRTDPYRAVTDNGYDIPAVPLERFEPRWRRQIVANPFVGEEPGTIVVDTPKRHFYLIRGDGEAIRYGVGVGRAGFEWAGRAKIQYKREWPTWTPPTEMIGRQPELAKYSAANGGMSPGLRNPLGARALYIFDDGKDTLYRVHGSPEWWTIGTAASSGCIRLVNQDVIDLYGRVTPGSPIRVIPDPAMMPEKFEQRV